MKLPDNSIPTLVDWDKNLNWLLHAPPSRPSQSHLRAISKVLKPLDRRSTRVCVLGSTPEFRDLLVDLRFQDVSIIDRSEVFHDAMTTIRRYPRSKEEWICQDWFEHFLVTPNSYDVILSDLTSGNIPYQRRKEFYNLISTALRTDGLFIDKVLTNAEGYRALDVLDRWFGRPGANAASLNQFSCAYFFTSELVERLGQVDVDEIIDQLSRRYSKTNLTQRVLLSYVPLLTPRGNIWHYGRSWSTLETEYCYGQRYYELASEPPSSPYYRRMTLFCMVKG